MKRTNILIDEALVTEGMAITGIKTYKDLVHKALSDLVRRGKQSRIKALKGKVPWDGDLDEMRDLR